MFDLVLLKAGCLLSVFVAVALLLHFLGNRPIRATQELGLRGLHRRRGLTSSDLWRASEPSVRWLAGWVSRLISDGTRTRLDAQLVKAGDPLGLEPDELVVITALFGSVGVLVGLAYSASNEGSPLAALLLGVGLSLAPVVRINALGQERSLRIRRTLPAAVDLMCLGLSAGLDFPGALRQIVEKTTQKDNPLIDELSVVLSELQLGKTRREALELFALRNPLDAVKEFVGFVIQAEEEGNPLAQILSIQATVARQRRGVLAEEAAGKATLKIIAPVGLVMMSVLILIAGPLILEVMKDLNGL